jgi:hypothetical protein
MQPNQDHILDFVKQRWDLKNKDIAEKYLKCDTSKLSKRPLREEPKRLYEVLFDIENSPSAAHEKKENKNELLGALKIFMEESGCHEDLADIWDSDYKDFVMELLRRAIIKPKKRKASIKNKKTLTLEQKKGENAAHNETPSERMLTIFVKNYRDCRISEFIGSDLFMGIDLSLLTWVDRFIRNIELDVIDMFKNHQTEIMYEKISQFTDTMREYKDYLKNNTRSWERDIIRLSANCRNQFEKDEFEKSTKYYRQRIFKLYREICDGNIFFTELKV